MRFGNTGRNQFYGPGGYNLDFSLFRGVPARAARKRLEVRIEAGNIFNMPVFANPTGSVTSGTFGQITGLRRQRQSYPERQIRFGVRFPF